MKNRNVWQTKKTGCQINRHKVKKWYQKTFKVYIHQHQTTCIYFSILHLWYHCHMDEIKSDTTPNRYATDSGLFAVSSYQIHTCRICLLLTIGKRLSALELTRQSQEFYHVQPPEWWRAEESMKCLPMGSKSASTGNEVSRCRTDIWSASRKPHVFLTATGLLTLRGIFGNHCFPKKINPDFIILQGGFTVTGFSCVLLCKTAVRYLPVGHLHCGNCKISRFLKHGTGLYWQLDDLKCNLWKYKSCYMEVCFSAYCL